MGEFRFVNETNAPLHVGAYNAGILYHYQNFLKPGTNVDWNDLAAIGWDLLIVRGSQENQLSESNNWEAILDIATITAGVLVTAASAALTIATGGATAGLTIAGVELLTTATTAAVAIGGAVGGSVIAAVSVAGAIAGLALQPVQLRGWYGGHTYRFTVTGNVEGELSPDRKTYTVTNVPPLKVAWLDPGRHLSGMAN